MLLLGVKLDGVADAVSQDHLVEGASDKIGDAEHICPLDERVRSFYRNHDDRNFVDPAVFVHDGENFHAVFFGHDHVEENQ